MRWNAPRIQRRNFFKKPRRLIFLGLRHKPSVPCAHYISFSQIHNRFTMHNVRTSQNHMNHIPCTYVTPTSEA